MPVQEKYVVNTGFCFRFGSTPCLKQTFGCIVCALNEIFNDPWHLNSLHMFYIFVYRCISNLFIDVTLDMLDVDRKIS